MNLEDSIQRLRRFGEPQSKTINKLREAAWFLAQHICAQAREARVSALPRGYLVREGRLLKGQLQFGSDMSVAAIHQMAADVAGGWLDEVRKTLAGS
jgi:hypothetical protein